MTHRTSAEPAEPTPPGSRLRAALAVGALAVTVALAGCGQAGPGVVSSPGPAFATPPAGAAPTTAEEGSGAGPAVGGVVITSGMTALEVLDVIPVKGRAPKTGYDREGAFGSAWLDVDRNGCDTRNDILARDLSDPVVAPGGCRVTAGTATSPYTGESIRFVRGNDTSTLLQIDHLVSLSNAWQTGAQQLGQAQRIALANDPINLLAVDQRSNAQKGDGDAATWLPSNRAFRCSYVARQVSVKATYGLWLTAAERDAVRRVLMGCVDEEVIVSPFAPVAGSTPAQTGSPAPAVPAQASPAPVPGPQHYDTCDAARAAGAAPVREGDPGYGKHLDREGDGIGCE